jgi:hypothetical protein
MPKIRGDLILEISLPLHPSAHSFSGLGLFHPLLLTRFKVNRVLFDLFDNGFLLDPSFKTPQGALERFSLIDNNKSQ